MGERGLVCYSGLMTAKSNPNKKPKLTDHERHERFVDMAREVEASEDEKDFEKALDKVTGKKPD